MSRSPIRTSKTAEAPLSSPGGAPAIMCGESAEPQNLAEIIAEREDFAAEVSRELSSIRSLLASLTTSPSGEISSQNLKPGSETVSGGPSRPPKKEPIARQFRSDTQLRQSEATEQRIVSEDNGSGPDRLAALKERIAAKLRAETDTTLPSIGTGDANGAEGTNGSVATGGSENANSSEDANIRPVTAEGHQS